MADDFKAVDLTKVYDDTISTRPFDLTDDSEHQSPKYVSGEELSNMTRIDSSWKDPQFKIPSALDANNIRGADLTKPEEFAATFVRAATDKVENIPDNLKNLVGQTVLEAHGDTINRLAQIAIESKDENKFLENTEVKDLVNEIVSDPNVFNREYDPMIVDALDGREYPVVQWARNTIANATKAVKDREIAAMLNKEQRGIDQNAWSNKFAEILGDMTPILAVGAGAGSIASALGASAATAGAVATGATQAATFVDMSGQYAYDTAREYLDKTGDSEFRNFTAKDAKGLSALGYGAIGTMIEFGFGGVEPLIGQAFTKAGVEQGIARAVGKVAAGEAWEEFLQDWEEFLFRKIDGTNNRTYGQALKDSLQAALWGGLTGGALGGVVYRTNRRNIANILTQTGLDYKDALKVADTALSDLQNNIQENAETALSIKNKTGEPYNRLRVAVDDALKVVEDQGRRVVREEEREEFIDGIVDNWGTFALNQANMLNMTIDDFLSDIQPRFENGEIRMYQPGYMSPQYTYERLQDIEKRISDIEQGIANEAEQEKYNEYKRIANQLRKINAARVARERTAARKAQQQAAKTIENTPKTAVAEVAITETPAIPQTQTAPMPEYSDIEILGAFGKALRNGEIVLSNWENVRWSSLNSAGGTSQVGKRKTPATESEKAKFARRMLDKYTPDWAKPESERAPRESKQPIQDAKKIQKGAYDITKFYNSLSDEEKAQYQMGETADPALQERFENALLSWIINDEQLFNQLVVQGDPRGERVIAGLRPIAQQFVEFNLTAPTEYRIDDSFRIALGNYITLYTNPNISEFYRSNDMIGQGGFDSNALLYAMRETNTPSGISDFLQAYIDGVVRNQQDTEYGKQARSEILAETIDKSFQSKKGTDQYNSLFTQLQRGAVEPLAPLQDAQIPNEYFDLADENAHLDDIYPAYDGETIEVDGKERTVYNSNGDRIAKSKEALTNFWRWFGDSKVVDEQGRPLVVYHGTNAEFDEFNINSPRTGVDIFGRGFYFTPYKNKAKFYGKMVMPVYLSITNPENITELTPDTLNPDTAKLKEEGKNGIIFDRTNDKTDELLTYVAFEPTQIKSVDNRGTYDLQDPNIYYDRSPSQWRGMFNMIRGAIAISGSVKPSTIQHELAHFWLDNMWNRYKSGKYTDAWLSNFQSIAKWLGVNLDADYISTPAHEQFARGYEAFISGRTIADVPGLKPAFDRYDRFVRRVYKTARDIRYRDATGHPTNPVFTKEAFDAFDRLLQVPDGVEVATNAELIPQTKEEKDENAKTIKKSIQETRTKIAEAQDQRAKENPSDVPILRTTGYAKDTDGKVKKSKNGYYIVSTQEGQEKKALDLIKSNPRLAESIIWGGANQTDIDRGVLARAYANFIKDTDPAKAELIREYEITTISRSAAKTLSHIPRNDLYRSAARQILAQKTRNLAQANYGLRAGMVEQLEKDLENRIALAWEAVKNAPMAQKQAVAVQQIREIASDFSTVDELPETLADADFTQVNERTFTEIAGAQIRRMLGLTLTQNESDQLDVLVEQIENTMQGESWERQHYLTVETARLLRQYSEFIAGYSPQTMWDKTTKLYYPASMLFNLPTHAKNIVTNFGQMISSSISSVLAAHTAIEIPAKQLIDDAKYDINLYLKTGFMPSVMTDITSPQQILGEKRMILQNPNWFDKAAEKTLNWLSIEDSVFKSISFYRELAIIASKQAKKEGLTGKALKARALELYREGRALRGQTEWGIETRAQASEIAKVDTFVGTNGWTRLARSARNTLNQITIRGRSANIGNILSPFIVVGTNIVRGGFNLTGLPIASGVAIDIFHPQTRINDTKVSELIDLDILSERQAKALFKGGKINQRVARTLIAEGQITEEELKGLTYTERFGGATIRGLSETGFAWLFILGLMSVLDDDDWMPDYDEATAAEKARAKEQGIQFGSIRFGNTWVSTDLFGYLKYPIHWAMNTRRFGVKSLPQSALNTAAELPVISDVMDLWNQNKYNKTTSDYLRTFGNTIIDKLNGFIPGVLNNIKRIAQKSGKLPTVKIEKKGKWSDLEKYYEKKQAREFDTEDIILYTLFGQAISTEE